MKTIQIKTKYLALTFGILLIGAGNIFSQPISRGIKTKEYRELQTRLCNGWNTWNTNSVMSHVRLPECFSINLCIAVKGTDLYFRDITKASRIFKLPEEVNLGLRSDDGSYTSLNYKYNGEEIKVESATEGIEEYILVTPIKTSTLQLVVETEVLWDRDGKTGVENKSLFGKFANSSIQVRMTELPVKDANTCKANKNKNLRSPDGKAIIDDNADKIRPHLSFSLNKEFGIYTGNTTKTLKDIKGIIEKKCAEQQKRVEGYGELAESFKAMQTILTWNTIYEPENNRVITPVSRRWNMRWGGYVLFDWDTYFASYMLGLFNKDLAYANAIEITKAITPGGFIPNCQAPLGFTSWDRSEPPIGSIVIQELFNKYGDKWLLMEVFDELLEWNQWWTANRSIKGYLAWGSNNVSDTLKTLQKHNKQAALYESGLDNSPMYDGVPFNTQTNMMELADVGLLSLYIADCNALTKIGQTLNRKDEAGKLRESSSKYFQVLATLWDNEKGIFLNKRTDTGEKSNRLSPTNFYPMLAKYCTQSQAETMIKKHYYNKDEFYGEYVMPSIARNDPAFKDNNYWRGRIWAPMNFLVYMGMRYYNLPEARKDLIEKSNALLMKSWKDNGSIYENYNATTGQGDDVRDADDFYHWGALLGFMSFIEKGYMEKGGIDKMQGKEDKKVGKDDF